MESINEYDSTSPITVALQKSIERIEKMHRDEYCAPVENGMVMRMLNEKELREFCPKAIERLRGLERMLLDTDLQDALAKKIRDKGPHADGIARLWVLHYAQIMLMRLRALLDKFLALEAEYLKEEELARSRVAAKEAETLMAVVKKIRDKGPHTDGLVGLLVQDYMQNLRAQMCALQDKLLAVEAAYQKEADEFARSRAAAKEAETLMAVRVLFDEEKAIAAEEARKAKALRDSARASVLALCGADSIAKTVAWMAEERKRHAEEKVATTAAPTTRRGAHGSGLSCGSSYWD